MRSDTENGDQPARKKYIDLLKQDIEQLRSEMNHQYKDLVERISDSETRLPNAFYFFGQSNQNRVTELEGNEAAIRSRIATIEDRLLEVET